MSKIYDALKRAEREREIARDRGGRDNGHPVEPITGRNGHQEEDDYRRLRASILFAPASLPLGACSCFSMSCKVPSDTPADPRPAAPPEPSSRNVTCRDQAGKDIIRWRSCLPGEELRS